MSGFLGTAISFLAMLGILIFVHELGHFLIAKKLGIKVLKFSLGFGPVIFGRKWGETEYVLSAVPLGGYVKLFGEDPETEVETEERDRTFFDRPVSHRIYTVLAGPLMNFALAVVLFGTLSLFAPPQLFGPPLHEPVVGEVSAGMPAEAAGILPGDRIVMIDNVHIDSWERMALTIRETGERKLIVKVERGGQLLEFEITPKLSDYGGGQMVPLIGVSQSFTSGSDEAIPFWKAPWIGVRETGRWTMITLEFVGKLFTGRESAKNVGGPIAIAGMAGKAAEAGMVNFLFMMALLSVNLGVLNLLPIPVLDGGHLAFFFAEAIRGKPVSLRVRETAQQLGMLILLALMVYITFNDIMRLGQG